MDVERAAKRIQSITGLIGIVGGLLTAVVAFNSQLREAAEVFASIGPLGLIGLAAALLLIGLWMFFSGRHRASRLIDPDALRLNARNPDHLIGRTEDIRILREKCEARPLTFLVGESGSGKTALAQAGLVPATSSEGHLLPVYVDMADLDWEAGPLAALASHFWRNLPADDRKKLNIEGPPGPDESRALLAECYSKLGKTPLIILDQIDNYQLRHRDRFLPPETHSWLGATDLQSQNKFWALLAALAAERHVHILLITRSDNADGLESLRLCIDPLVVRLDPLPAGFVLRVVDQLTQRPAGDRPVIENPKQGWERLRTRLADDLERSGSVLPQQLKLTLLGLARLKALSVVRYERAGGVEGLEARYIEDALARGAARAGVSVIALRAAILRLVERDGRHRAPPLSTADLGASLAGRAPATILPALEALEEADILLRRESGGTTAWQLDHDYLARGILRAEMNADRWKALLVRRAQEFEDARGSWRARRRALLSLREQLGLLFVRLLGRFRYGEQRGFAMRSAARHAVIATILAGFVAAADIAFEVAKAEFALTLVTPQESLTPFEGQVLADVAQMSDFGRAWFARRLLQEPMYAMRAASKPDAVVRALIGLDVRRARYLVDWFIAPRFEGRELVLARASAHVLAQLPRSVQLRVPPMAEVLSQTGTETLPLQERILSAAASDPAGRALAQKKADMALRWLKGSVEHGTGTNRQWAYAAGVFASTSLQVPTERLPEALAIIRGELRAARGDEFAVAALARNYSSIALRLPVGARMHVAMDLIEEIRAHRGRADIVQELALAVGNVGRTLPAEPAKECSRALLEQLRAGRGDPNTLVPIAFALAATAPVATSERAEAAAIAREALDGDMAGLAEPVAEVYAMLTLERPVDRSAHAKIAEALRDEMFRWAQPDEPKARDVLQEMLFEGCWSSNCYALFAATILDKAAMLPFEDRAGLIVELLKVPMSAQGRLTESLLERLRAEAGAEGARVPSGNLWELAAWAEAQGLRPGKRLDPSRLLKALAQ